MHLRAAGAAMLVAALGLFLLDQGARKQIRRHAVALAALNVPEVARGVELQRRLARLPGCLTVYGSSELTQYEPTRADLFFRDCPTGFRVGVIGQPGDRCLLVLQELAALGDCARGRKFAVFLSPTWFIAPAGSHATEHLQRQFARDFSPVQTGLLLLDKRLDAPLKAAIARRLMDRADVIRESSPLLAGAMDAVQGASPWQGVYFRLLTPLLALQTEVLRWQDRRRTAGLEIPSSPPPTPHGSSPDWAALRTNIERDLAQRGTATPYSLDLPGGSPMEFQAEAARLPLYPHGNREFLRRLDASPEWTDLRLLLRTIRCLGAHVLLVEQPFNGSVYDACHIDAATRRQFYDRVRAEADAHGVPLRDFSGFEEDRSFFSDLVHPSAKAWIDYDQVLDRFYHERG